MFGLCRAVNFDEVLAKRCVSVVADLVLTNREVRGAAGLCSAVAVRRLVWVLGFEGGLTSLPPLALFFSVDAPVLLVFTKLLAEVTRIFLLFNHDFLLEEYTRQDSNSI